MTLFAQNVNEPLINFAWAPHSPYLTSEKALSAINEHALKHHLPIHIHCQETQHEINTSLEHFGKRPWARLKDMGFDHPLTLAVHMVATTTEDIALIEQASVAACPVSNFKLGSGIAPIAQMLAHDINVSLGTDGAASNNSLDMLLEMRMLALSQKGFNQDASLLPCWQVIECATINGAKTLGLEDKIGSLTAGKDADMIAINLDHPRTYPHHDPLSQCIHAATSEQVSHTWVKGKLLLENGKFTNKTLDEYAKISKKWAPKTAPFAKN